MITRAGLFARGVDGKSSLVKHGNLEKLSIRVRLFSEAVVERELQIIDTRIGTGKTPSKGALLFVHYEGFLSDGTKFDSSRDKGRPFQFVFGTGRVIKGWDQGLVGMQEGGARTLHVPSHLAYAERSVGNLIPPNSDLTFFVELLEVRTRDE